MNSPDQMKQIPLAIVGMACRLPGADNLDEYWQLVSEGRSAIAEVPHEILDQDLYFDPRKGVRNKTYSKLAALVKSKKFDHDRCPISQELVDAVDHCHLLMCQTAYEALAHGGYDPMNLPTRNVAVYIGHAQGSGLAGDNTYGTGVEEAAQFLREVDAFQALPSEIQQAVIDEVVADVQGRMPQVTAKTDYIAGHMVAGTITKAFGLTGPFLALNSACASSLQAIMMGARALQSGQVEMAIVGGASDCKSDSLVLFSAAQSMSANGSRPFDTAADGLIMGEGYVCIVMKTLERAIADGDNIQAVVSGAGVASDGKGKSLWAPRKEGQLKAMQRAYAHGLDRSKLQYLEAHSTATQVGDATEISSVTEFLEGAFPPGHKIPVTSVKANIGHTLEAAGMSGVIKSVLCMQRGIIPPAINIDQINPKIDWEKAPVFVPRSPQPWPQQSDGSPRRAGVNAFGIGGLNMHVVIDEYVPAAAQAMIAKSPRLNSQGVPATLTPGSDEASLAIVGMGCVMPGALNRQEFWQLLVDGRDPKTTVPAGRFDANIYHSPGSSGPHRTPITHGGYITNFEYDWRRHKVPPKQVQQADPLQFMLLTAADEAIADSGYHEKAFDRTRAGVIMGTEFGGDFSYQLQLALRIPEMQRLMRQSLSRRGVAADAIAEVEKKFADVLLSHWPALIDESGSFSTSSLASRITKTWDLMGGAVTIDCGSASPLAALNLASDMLLAGDTDMMICCAGQRCMGVTSYEMFAAGGMLDTSGQPRAPFDRDFGGIVPGEGVGVLILKRLADAKRDGDKIHAIIRSTAAAHSEAWGDALKLSLERSCAAAQVQPTDVAVWENNGTGYSASNVEFAKAFVESQAAGREGPALIGSVSSLLGHASGASGMASLIKASMAIESGELPGTAHLDSPLPVLAEQPSLVQQSSKLSPIDFQTSDGRRLGAVSSVVKELVYNVILERGTKLPVRPVAHRQPLTSATPVAMPAKKQEPVIGQTSELPAEWHICRCGGTNLAELKTKLGMLLTDPRGWYLLADRPFNPEQKYRLAIIADSPATLEKKARLASQQLDNSAARGALDQQGIFFRKRADAKPRIAFLFPGQGSQYAGMLRDLVTTSPAAERAMRSMDSVLKRHGYQTFAEMAWQDNPKLGGDVWTTQVAILVADSIVHSALTEMGIRADVVAGHSYGEFTALLAAESWTFEQVLAVTRARCSGIEACPTARGGMLATSAPANVVESMAAQAPFAGHVFLANYNAPDQTVMGGRSDALDQFASSLKQHGYQAKTIAVPSPFHTPIMSDAAGPLESALRSATIRPPRIPMISVVNNSYVSDPREIRRNLVAHLMSPVRYVDLVQRLVEEEPTALVEVGPQATLTRLHQKILDGQTVIAIATDHPKRSGQESLLGAKALLECVGAFTPIEVDHRARSKTPVRASSGATKAEIIHFDATQLRKEKMRQASSGAKPSKTSTPAPRPSIAPPSATVRPSVKPAAPVKNRVAEAAPVTAPRWSAVAAPGQNGIHRDPPTKAALVPAAMPTVKPIVPVPAKRSAASLAPTQLKSASPAPVVTPPAQPVAQITPAAPTAPAVAPANTSAAETADLEAFLVNFVVEQTGYPPEVVELDADLEADLGIDSIKKAQLFGELQEYFDITTGEDLTLDQFPTLRHIVRFLAQSTGAAAAAPTPVVTPASAAVAPVVDTPAVVAPVAATPVPVAENTVSVPSGGGTATADLEKFMVNFVVEQTGYPPEVVELDADLEADLGIDSIKKAQLFGELQEYFDVAPSEDLTLDQFPTLRHIVRFLDQATSGPTATATATATEAATGPTAPAPPAPALAPAPVAIAPVAVVPVAVVPATVVPVASSTDTVTDEGTQETSVAAGSQTADLEQFMVNFVVEQTGYPPEVVELDADLEADLGIDSIKKAQLFGELQEYFDVAPSEDLTLDQFPTLRHIVRFLDQATSGPTDTATPTTVAPAPVAAAPTPVAAAPVPVVAAPAPVAAAPTPAPVAAAPAPVAVAPAAIEPPAMVPMAASTDTMAREGTRGTSAATGSQTADLEQFMVNFVVEQTGYPPEVVELDADLEADLGIDSIKKAQLFGELQEYFDVAPSEDLTLDQFPTLRHIVRFLDQATSGPTDTPVPAVPASPAPVPSAIEPVAVAPATPSTDTMADEVTQGTSVAAGSQTADLEQFMVNFVVEQTGYPPEVVELDADLEADLGIDSIKKAQLFGELQEYFDVAPSEDLTLDQFPTLRHIVRFLDQATGDPRPPESPPAPTSGPYAGEAHEFPTYGLGAFDSVERSGLTSSSTSVAPLPGMTDGGDYTIALKRVLRRFADCAHERAGQSNVSATELLAQVSPAVRAELESLAGKASVPIDNLMALAEALASEMTVAEAQAAFTAATSPFATATHVISSRLPLSGGLAAAVDPQIVVRKSADAIAAAVVEIAGLPGSTCGINASGISLTLGSLAETSIPTSLELRMVVPNVLAVASDLQAAVDQLQSFSSLGPWTAWLGQLRDGAAYRIDCDGASLTLLGEDEGAISPQVKTQLSTSVTTHLRCVIQPGNETLVVDGGHNTAFAPIPGSSFDLRSLNSEVRPQEPVAETQASAAPVQASAELDDPMCQRYQLQLAELPLPDDTPAMFTAQGAALILGDNPSALALEHQLRSAGVTVNRLPIMADLDATLEGFERLWQQAPIAHLFLMTGRDEIAADLLDPNEFARVRYRNVTVPYFVTQRFVQRAGEAKILSGASVIGVTNLGGDFGVSGRIQRPEGGALTGLLKCLFIEWYVQGMFDFIIKAVDAPPQMDGKQLAGHLCREIAGRTLNYEVAYQDDRRFITLATEEDAEVSRNAEIRPGGTWIVTGGARGITAECALELAKRYHLKLHLLGSSSLPTRDPAWRGLDDEGLNRLKAQVMLSARQSGENAPERWAAVEKAIQIDRALSGYEQAGVNYVYHCCDVANREALAGVISKIRPTDGPIDGVLHGAGIDRACRFEKKQRESVDATIGCKVDGAYHLLTLLADAPPAHFVGLGSITGRFGGNGQTDYGLANDWLCKLAAWYRTVRPGCHATGFHFHPWGDVGMAALPEVQARMKRMGGPELMPKDEGVLHVVRELIAGGSRAEVLITSAEYRDRYYPKELFEKLAEIKQAATAEAQHAASSEPPLNPDVPCLAQRWISVTVPRPLGANTAQLSLPGGALIIGDNPVGQALADRLRSLGITASVLSIGTEPAETIARLEAAWANQPARHLFVATSWDSTAGQLEDPASCQQRTSRGVLIPAFVIHRWLGLVQSADEASQPSIVAVTSLGGDFGLGGITVPEGGALSGLLKAFYLEGARRPSDKPLIKAIDFDPTEKVDSLVEQVLAEVAAQDPEIEVGYQQGQRHVVRSQQQPSDGLPEHSPRRGGVWVVTGGARGITCASALHLGKRYGLKLHLLGVSPPPQDNPPWRNMTDVELKQYKSTVVREAARQGRSVNDAWTPIRKDIEIFESLQEYQRAGVEAHYHQCDTGNWSTVEQTLKQVRQISGPIEGILHGAGWTKPLKAGGLDPEITPRVFGPKADGTLALMLYTMSDPVRHFVGFGSISGRFGGNGMSDYAGANDLLAKLVGWYRGRRADCAASVIHWQTWDDTGMAVQHDAAIGSKSTLKMEYIRAAEGVYHLEKEIRLGLPHPEVIIFDGHFERIFYPHHEQYSAPDEVTPESGRTPIERPIVDKIAENADGTWTANVQFDPTRDVFLNQHLLRGKPFLPGVAGLEVLAEAASLAVPDRKIIRLRDVSIINGLLFHDDSPIDAKVTVTSAEGGLQCVLSTELRNRKGVLIDPHRVCSQAIVEFADVAPALTETYPSEPPLGWFPHDYPDHGLLYHGDALRAMKRCSFQRDGAYGEIIAPSIEELAVGRSDQGWIYPVSVLDACVVGCGSFCWIQFGGRLEVPHGFDSLCLVRQPQTGERLVLRLHYLGTEGRHSRFNFTLFGEDREPILQALGYRTILVGEASSSA